ncbi:MAG: GntR family transcriptional regulator [Rubellimicrobium sp.]|nr:GntR family transcriptional regulator [Rubellimicrobium sp.]
MTLMPDTNEPAPSRHPAEPQGYHLLREAMDRGDLQPGMALTQNEMCRILGLSLTPLREALVLLQAYGLVDVRPRTGIHIVYPDVAFIRENFQFRILIEVNALKVFAQTDLRDWLVRNIAAHERSTHELSESGNIDAAIARFIAVDQRFHADIVGVFGNPTMLATHRRLQANIGMARLTHKRVPFRQQLLDTVDEHRKILAALEDADRDGAIAALEAHFQASTHRTFAA